jgi:hypothetical protein
MSDETFYTPTTPVPHEEEPMANETFYVASNRGGGSAQKLHAATDCPPLRSAVTVREASAQEIRERAFCERCTGEADRGDADWSYQEALEAAAEEYESDEREQIVPRVGGER